MIVVGIIAYVALGIIVLTMLDVHTKGRLKAWADSAPLEILKWAILLGWPIVFALALFCELRAA